jgi:hypothetical protein
LWESKEKNNTRKLFAKTFLGQQPEFLQPMAKGKWQRVAAADEQRSEKTKRQVRLHPRKSAVIIGCRLP